jgi:hypothetical protein
MPPRLEPANVQQCRDRLWVHGFGNLTEGKRMPLRQKQNTRIVFGLCHVSDMQILYAAL